MKLIYESKSRKRAMFAVGLSFCFLGCLSSWYFIVVGFWELTFSSILPFLLGIMFTYDSFQPPKLIQRIIETDDECRKLYGVDLQTLRDLEEFWSL